MFRCSAISALLLACLLLPPPARAGDLLERSNPRTIRVRADSSARTKLQSKAGELRSIIAVMTVPVNNEYQEAKPVARVSDSSLMAFPETGDKYLSYRKRIRPSKGNDILEIFYEYDVTMYDVAVDFKKIDYTYPWKETIPLYARYTRTVKPYIMPQDSRIFKMSRAIIVDNKLRENEHLLFARCAYKYIVDNFRLTKKDVKYINGMAGLEKTLDWRRGDSGALANVFISLLRCRKIPARHLIGIKPDGTPHIMADFYLQGYGWIPVDIAGQMTFRERDFFGRLYAKLSPVILAHDLELTASPPEINRRTMTFIHAYSHWLTLTSGRFVDPDMVETFRFGLSGAPNEEAVKAGQDQYLLK